MLDSPEMLLNSRQERAPRPARRSNKPHIPWVTELFLGKKKRPERQLVTNPHLLASLTISGAILEFLHRPSWCAQGCPVVRFILNIHYWTRDIEECWNMELNLCMH
jgi:hypothetical protein